MSGGSGEGRGEGAGDGVIDPDVDLRVPAQRAETAGAHAVAVLAAVAAGGALGACARYALTLPWPAAPGGFPWAVLAVNAAGCALIGVLMALLEEHGGKGPGGARARHPLTRPFLGTGVLGGFTTFSVYALDAVRLLEEGAAGTALLYLGATPAAALGAVWAATAATRAAVAR
ncbi:FluC/FEX family fluoride channel [Streptomyces verrucosisporus]|uniref:FluC/FEX family fluoride channel n=1 Tax=Streptomyces verrucosisporus TaxID=1695161 RepID=UPI0027DA97C9|nr:CrcB family protein [Streptomyces verrucosisporus]